MLYDIRYFAQTGADGVVIGSLKEDGTLNEEQMRGMIEAAGNSGITLHRALMYAQTRLSHYKEQQSWE